MSGATPSIAEVSSSLPPDSTTTSTSPPTSHPAVSSTSASSSSSPPPSSSSSSPSFTDTKPRPSTPPSDDAQDLDCNICLFTSSEPVVSRCGHLYCWACLHQWLQAGHSDCPVCKTRINSKGDIIPLYGRSSRSSARTQSSSSAPNPSLPPRPTPFPPSSSTPPLRSSSSSSASSSSSPPPLPLFTPSFNFHSHHGAFSFSAGYGLFPAIFGLQFFAFQLRDLLRGEPDDGEEQGRDARLSRFLMFLGVFMLLLLLMY